MDFYCSVSYFVSRTLEYVKSAIAFYKIVKQVFKDARIKYEEIITKKDLVIDST